MTHVAADGVGPIRIKVVRQTPEFPSIVRPEIRTSPRTPTTPKATLAKSSPHRRRSARTRTLRPLTCDQRSKIDRQDGEPCRLIAVERIESHAGWRAPRAPVKSVKRSAVGHMTDHDRRRFACWRRTGHHSGRAPAGRGTGSGRQLFSFAQWAKGLHHLVKAFREQQALICPGRLALSLGDSQSSPERWRRPATFGKKRRHSNLELRVLYGRNGLPDCIQRLFFAPRAVQDRPRRLQHRQKHPPRQPAPNQSASWTSFFSPVRTSGRSPNTHLDWDPTATRNTTHVTS